MGLVELVGTVDRETRKQVDKGSSAESRDEASWGWHNTQYAIRSTQHATALRRYWPLIKSLQTGLLLATGVAGYLSAVRPAGHWLTIFGLMGSLFLAISGSTVLNMAYDRDIDACMKRTCWRPLPTGQVSLREAVSSAWCSRRWASAGRWRWRRSTVRSCSPGCSSTWWSTRSGSSGARLARSSSAGWRAGCRCWRAGLAVGQMDPVGVMLALGVLFWIPTHIMTFSMRHFDDYRAAGVPTFPAAYGFYATRVIIAVSSLAAALIMAWIAATIGGWGCWGRWPSWASASWGWRSSGSYDLRRKQALLCSSSRRFTCSAPC